MRTKQEIKTEIAALKALKPTGPFKNKTTRSIALAIEELESGWDQTAGEFEELDSSHQDIIRQANEWKEGAIDEPVSEGWGILVE